MRPSLLSGLFLATLSGVFVAEDSDVIDLTGANFDSIVKPAELILVEFFAPWCRHSQALAPHYEEAAATLKANDIKIAKVDCVENSELCQTHGVSGYPTLKVFRNGTPSDYYTGPRKADGIVSYMVKQSLPAVTTVTADKHAEFIDEISGKNYGTYAESGLPLAYIFVDPASEDKQAVIDSFKGVAKTFKGKVNFVWIDAIKFSEHGKAMNLQEAKWPAFVIQDIEKKLKYPFDQTATFSAATVGPFVQQYVDGELQPSLKSAPVPASQDEPVVVLVSKQFDEIVFDDSKDVFVEFYIPWCGRCRSLKSTWDSLGKKYAAVKNQLVIAKMDATENDIPLSAPFRISLSAPFRVGGFPTIKFKPAGGRDFIDYEGDRSLEALIEFVESKAKNSLVAAASAGTESAGTESASAASVTPETVVPVAGGWLRVWLLAQM